jgi:probable DNA metabolism protein
LPSDVVYHYDGGLAGFFCCVYESVYFRELPAAILPEKEAQPTLFQIKTIITDRDKAARVRQSIPAKISRDALSLTENVFLSCLPQKELLLLRFLLLAYRQGAKTLQMMGHPDVAPLLKAEKHLLGEAHLLRGFVRFSDYEGILAASITPKNFILPYIAGHFCARFCQESFLIYDKTHKAALIYQEGRRRIVPLEHLPFPQAGEEEIRYRDLWKRFYHTVAIEARYNPKCRMTHLPKRYWENMTEMQELL